MSKKFIVFLIIFFALTISLTATIIILEYFGNRYASGIISLIDIGVCIVGIVGLTIWQGIEDKKR